MKTTTIILSSILLMSAISFSGCGNTKRYEKPLVIEKDTSIEDNLKAEVANTLEAEAGQNQIVLLNEDVLLDASNSTQGTANIVSYSWTEGSTLLSNQVSFSINNLSIGRHTLVLTITDSDNITSTDTVNITIITKAKEQYNSEFVHLSENIYTGGDAESLVALGNYLFVVDNKAGLQIIDVSNPSSPKIISNIATYGVQDAKITLSANNLYIAYDEGLLIYDISKPSSPTFMGKIDIQTYTLTGESNVNGIVEKIIVSGEFAYIAYANYGIAIIDTNKINLSTKSSENYISDTYRTSVKRDIITEDYIYDFSVSKNGNYIYVADGDKGFKIFDISDKSSSTLVATKEMGNYAKSLAHIDNTVYVMDGWKNIKVISVSNPNKPLIVKTISTNHTSYESINDMQIFGDTLYYTDSNGVTIFNIANANSPMLMGTIYTGYAEALTIAGNYAYVKDINGAINEVIISMPFPHITGSIYISDTAEKIVLSDSYAYIASGYKGLNIVNMVENIKILEGDDILDYSEPLYIPISKNIDLNVSINDIVIKNNYAYLASGEEGLVIINITDPKNPVKIKSLNTQGTANGITILNNYVYIANGEKGLTIIDISNVNNPFITGSIDTDGISKEIIVSGNYVYIADYDGGLKIIDITNKSIPSVIANFETNGLAQDIALKDNLIYLADDSQGLKIIDVSNPNSPTLVSSLDSHDALGVSISENYLYLADDEKGLKIIDISHPSTPTILGMVTTDGSVYDVNVLGDFVYIVDSLGVKIVDLSKLAK